MAFEQYLAIPTVVDLSSDDKVEALKELSGALCRKLEIKKSKGISDEILRREEAASTFIGQGLALPQARGPIKDEFAIIVGRSMRGIGYNTASGALAHVIALLVCREDADNNLQIQLLAEMADFFKSDAVRAALLSPKETIAIRDIIRTLKKSGTTPEKKAARKQRKAVMPVLRTAMILAREIKASAVMVFADAVRENDFLDQIKTRARLIVVTSNRARFDLKSDRRIKGFLQVPSVTASRTGQIKIGILLALSRNLIKSEDRIVCISGNPNNNVFDTVVVINVEKEYGFFFTTDRSIVPPDVKPEVLERLIAIAGEIAVEGREGKPIGTIFVVGDTNSVNVYVRQLIINPFRGYSDTERNILDPSFAETVKEFAAIDGAFILTGDGIMLSAGSYLRPQPVDDRPEIPSGFGARHAAAAGITACTNALSVVVSESTGMVTLFKNGAAVMALARPVTHDKNQVHRFL
jgi:DNA integrity scanning protein DisA with diadenylate cyclase activity/mannitol/fructose-specific phosphotransferase system IIA component (Ntr-type)